MSHDTRKIGVLTRASTFTVAEQAKDLAKKLGFSEVDQTKIAIATSELAVNIVVHAQGRGRTIIKTVTENGKTGIEIVAEDEGPGIANVEKTLQGNVASKTGLGIGLGAVKRLMDEFKIETKVGEGTKIVAKKWL